jgi:hypothetical protein
MIKNIIIFLVVAVLVYVGIQFAKPHYQYNVFKSDVEDLSLIITISPQEMMHRIIESAQDSDIPITRDDVILERQKGGHTIAVNWTKTVNIFDLYQKTYYFSVRASP